MIAELSGVIIDAESLEWKAVEIHSPIDLEAPYFLYSEDMMDFDLVLNISLLLEMKGNSSFLLCDWNKSSLWVRL